MPSKKCFSTEVKQIEVNQVEKFHFLMNNLPQECAICDLAIDPFVKNGWFEHACLAEYVFSRISVFREHLFQTRTI